MQKKKPHSLLPLLTLEHFAVAKLLHDDQEYKYFCHFKEETVFELSESVGFARTLWNYITLQNCESQPCLRTLLVAVAALSKASRLEDTSFNS